MSQNDLYKAALYYADRGLAVFPLHERSKEPIFSGGFKNATTDKKKIGQWWAAHPNANIGIACGELSGGLVVIDCDKHEDTGEDGWLDLQKYAREHKGKIPDTTTVITGGGGTHLLFKSTTLHRNRARLYGAIDIRGEGGYIVAPPSIHPSGNIYDFDGGDIDEQPIAEVNDLIVSLLNEKPEGYDKPAGFQIPEEIPSSRRNETLFKSACKFRQSGLEFEEMVTIMTEINSKRCKPPIDSDELMTICESACRYKAGVLLVPSSNNRTAAVVERKPEFKVDDKGRIIQCIKNCEEAIEYDENLAGRIKFNELVGTVYCVDIMPWNEGVPTLVEREWTDSDDNNLRTYLEKYGMKNKDYIMTALSNVANRHRYHPVRKLLEDIEKTVPVVKGSIENLMPNYLGAEKNRLNTSILTTWMLGAIKRIYDPGCKFDYALILVGSQGVGKSTFISKMALNPRFYNDNLSTIEGDKAFEKIRGIWIAEMAELLAQKSAKDVEAMKAYITSQNDRYREPYARRSGSHPRQCVFAGTTNENMFLVDQTGNRRFLPVRINKSKVKKNLWADESINDFKLAWAEALSIYRSGDYSLIIPKDLEYAMEVQRAEFQEENAQKSIIEEWIDKNINPGNIICVAMVREISLKEDRAKLDAKSSKIIATWLDEIPSVIRIGKRRVGVYGVTQAWQKIDFKREF